MNSVRGLSGRAYPSDASTTWVTSRKWSLTGFQTTPKKATRLRRGVANGPEDRRKRSLGASSAWRTGPVIREVVTVSLCLPAVNGSGEYVVFDTTSRCRTGSFVEDKRRFRPITRPDGEPSVALESSFAGRQYSIGTPYAPFKLDRSYSGGRADCVVRVQAITRRQTP